MAVEYEISSDVATITGVASNTQVASIVKFYTGSITYDDEPTSKYASVTINGKTQRVMLCVAVSGTASDDVPCLYSTVSGHTTLNVVEPTESGTPDDVPSLYETVVVNGKTVRALRCVLINKTPNYDGVSSTCTFTDNGKTHTAQLVNQVSSGSIETIVKGVSPLSLPDAIANSLQYVKAFGGTEQGGVPSGYTLLNGITNGANTAVATGIQPTVDDVEWEIRVKPTTDSWYILQARSGSQSIWGISGSQTGATILLGWNGNQSLLRSDIVRNTTHTYYVKGTVKNGVATLYVKDETNNTEDTQTTTYTFDTEQLPSSQFYLFANGNPQYVAAGNKVFMARIKVGGVTVMDYVPALNPSNVVGFYDNATGDFKVSSSGTLTADQTLVPTPDAPMDIVSNNGVLKYSANMANVIEQNIAIGKYISAQGLTLDSVSNFIYKTFIPVKPNTTYTLGLSEELYYVTISEYTSADSSGFIVRKAGSGGNTSLTITTEPTTQYIRWGSNPYGNNNTVTWEQIQAINFMLTETATPLPYAPYSPTGIYTDGTVETLGMRAGNLVDNSIVGANINVSGEIVSSGNTFITHTAPVIPGETYTCNGLATLAYYTSKPNIGSVSYNNNRTVTTNPTFTVPNDPTIKYVAFRNATDDSWVVYNGGTATTEMLLKVGDYQDVQSIIDGVVTRNVGVLVLDGTETWSASATYNGSTYTPAPHGYINNKPLLCTHFVSATRPTVDFAQGKCLINGGSLSLWYSDNRTTAVADITQYLADQYAAGTPVMVIYPLATPTTESVAGQTLQVQAGDNTLEITQASLTGLELEAKYSKSA